MAPQFKGVFPRFPKWAVYEMILGFPFHTGHGFFIPSSFNHANRTHTSTASIVGYMDRKFGITGSQTARTWRISSCVTRFGHNYMSRHMLARNSRTIDQAQDIDVCICKQCILVQMQNSFYEELRS